MLCRFHTPILQIQAMVSILVVLASTAAAYAVPSSPSQSPLQSSIDQKCTFTLFHKQLCLPFSPSSTSTSTSTSPPSKSKTNYILLPTIHDHPNSLTISVALHRPREAFHSYTRISRNHEFAVKGLIDDTTLSIRGEDGLDEVVFAYDGLMWSSAADDDDNNNDDGSSETWCEVEEWDAKWEVCGDEGSVNPRERKIHCAFPCQAAVQDEMRIELV